MFRSLYILIIFILCYSCRTKQKQDNSHPTTTEAGRNEFRFKHKDFENFYHRFIGDSIYQLNHVQFPVKGNYQTYDEERSWSKKKWPMIRFNIATEANNNQDSVSIEQDSTRFFYGNYCIDCGFSFEMEFKKLNSEWKLVYRQENNF